MKKIEREESVRIKKEIYRDLCVFSVVSVFFTPILNKQNAVIAVKYKHKKGG